MSVRTADLTPGERLLLHRRRHHWTIRKAARHWRVPVSRYVRWEHDEVYSSDQPSPELGRLDLHEQAFVCRRRAGVTRAELADQLGLSMRWVTMMERGRVDATKLATHWDLR